MNPILKGRVWPWGDKRGHSQEITEWNQERASLSGEQSVVPSGWSPGQVEQ